MLRPDQIYTIQRGLVFHAPPLWDDLPYPIRLTIERIVEHVRKHEVEEARQDGLGEGALYSHHYPVE
jgi:hypothetical protein